MAFVVVVTARSAARAWWTNVQRVLATLEAGRGVDAEQYEEQVLAEIREFTNALYQIPGRKAPADDASTSVVRPWADLMTRTSLHLIGSIHWQARSELQAGELEELRREGEAIHRVISYYLVQLTEEIGGGRVDDLALGPPVPDFL
ncbi:hypothetical protein [Streptomyces phaeochromogenes]|uniref:hypothetical protein n=1 Tax=Streptomyces phaeochromogenes TaxID=1923 RepID=UPI003711DA8B